MGDGKEVIELLAKNPNTREIHLDKTGAQICFGYSAAIVDRENVADISIQRRRHPRGDAHDDLFAGILVAPNPSAQK